MSPPEGFSSQERDSHVTGNHVTWPPVTGSDPEVTSFDRKSPGSGCRRPKTGYTVHFTSYKAVARRGRQSHDGKWPKVTASDLEVSHLNRSHLQVAVEGWKLGILYISLPTRLHLVGGGSHATRNDVTWSQGTGSAPEVTTFHRK